MGNAGSDGRCPKKGDFPSNYLGISLPSDFGGLFYEYYPVVRRSGADHLKWPDEQCIIPVAKSLVSDIP